MIIEHCANGQAPPGAARNRLLTVRRDIEVTRSRCSINLLISGDGGPVALPDIGALAYGAQSW